MRCMHTGCFAGCGGSDCLSSIEPICYLAYYASLILILRSTLHRCQISELSPGDWVQFEVEAGFLNLGTWEKFEFIGHGIPMFCDVSPLCWVFLELRVPENDSLFDESQHTSMMSGVYMLEYCEGVGTFGSGGLWWTPLLQNKANVHEKNHVFGVDLFEVGGRVLHRKT